MGSQVPSTKIVEDLTGLQQWSDTLIEVLKPLKILLGGSGGFLVKIPSLQTPCCVPKRIMKVIQSIDNPNAYLETFEPRETCVYDDLFYTSVTWALLARDIH